MVPTLFLRWTIVPEYPGLDQLGGINVPTLFLREPIVPEYLGLSQLGVSWARVSIIGIEITNVNIPR